MTGFYHRTFERPSKSNAYSLACKIVARYYNRSIIIFELAPFKQKRFCRISIFGDDPLLFKATFISIIQLHKKTEHLSFSLGAALMPR